MGPLRPDMEVVTKVFYMGFCTIAASRIFNCTSSYRTLVRQILMTHMHDMTHLMIHVQHEHNFEKCFQCGKIISSTATVDNLQTFSQNLRPFKYRKQYHQTYSYLSQSIIDAPLPPPPTRTRQLLVVGGCK